MSLNRGSILDSGVVAFLLATTSKPTQRSIQRIQRTLSRGQKERSVKLATHLHQMTLLNAFMA